MCSGKTQPGKISGANSIATETEDQSSRRASDHKNQSHSAEVRRVNEADAVISPIRKLESPVERKRESPGERNPVSKVIHSYF